MKITKENLALELAVEQLHRVGFDGDPYEEVKKDGWYSKYEWPSDKMEEEFRQFAIKQIMKTFKIGKKFAEKEFAWWNLAYGVKSFFC